MAGDRLVSFPYVVVRVSCANCQRAALRACSASEKYGANIPLQELHLRLVADCGAKNPRHPIHRECQASFTERSADPTAGSARDRSCSQGGAGSASRTVAKRGGALPSFHREVVGGF